MSSSSPTSSLWRNTRRSCIVLFKNIRELPDSSLENDGDDWKLVIDFPFDEAGTRPTDDLSKLQAFKQSHPNGAKTLCWVPAFFSHDAQKDLGLLVILEHILTGERYAQYAEPPVAPGPPGGEVAAGESAERLAAAGAEPPRRRLWAGAAVARLARHGSRPGAVRAVRLALAGFEPRPPVAANLAGAMNHLVSQALDHEFPAAPQFEAEVKSSNLKKVFEVVSQAARATDDRVAGGQELCARLVRSIANPLKLGEMGLDATHFVLGQHWKNHFTQKARGDWCGARIEVRQLRKWIDEPKAMGLPKEAENLVILILRAADEPVILHARRARYRSRR